ncbi:MAG TPA: protein-L-isoaspartate(D-aspartate) O-methyltransferase [Candidatus Acidoferrales bacterium]|nr:protein-L-isoaspartate(D-aspartate) O-methyltransferase [Candidatus Acidoferrales bacterium]
MARTLTNPIDVNESFVNDAHFAEARRNMVEKQLRRRGIRSGKVLEAMECVPRHAFVPLEVVEFAYADHPLGIGEGQTISQPFMVAAIAEGLALEGNERLLEIGGGSGYSAAVMSLLADKVFSIETHESLSMKARNTLAELGYSNVDVRWGDGSAGLTEEAPFDAIAVAAAAPEIPKPLMDQLTEGGRLVIPVGPPSEQELLLVRRTDRKLEISRLHYCRFVPLTGQYGVRS